MSFKLPLFPILAWLALSSCGPGIDEAIDDGSDPTVSGAAPEALSSTTAFGYGQHAVGGCTAAECRCEVTTTADSGPGSLRSCVANDDSRYVVFTGAGRGVITLNNTLEVGSNKTIDGRGVGRVTLTGQGIHLMEILNRQNVVITDVAFKLILSAACKPPPDPATTFECGGGIQILGASKDIWINQSQFDSCGGKCIAVWTREPAPFVFNNCAYKAKGGDLITISNNVFQSSFYGVLVGANHSLANCQIPLMRATVYRNVFRNIDRRSPRASELAHVHVLNNVVSNWGANVCDDSQNEAFGASVMSGAQMLLENNWFEARDSASSCKVATHIDGGFMKAIGNVARNGAIVSSSLPGRVFDPRAAVPERYDYVAATMTGAMRQQVEDAAGPRL